MRDSVHIRRFVHPESIPSLRFRFRAKKEFGRLGLEMTPSHNLHTTIIHERNFTGSMQDIADTMRQQPGSTDQPIDAHVIGGGAIGRNRITQTSWFALLLDNNDLDRDFERFNRLSDDTHSEIFTPHVTLFKTTNPTSPAESDAIGEWIQDNAPRSIHLKPISASWSVRNEDS